MTADAKLAELTAAHLELFEVAQALSEQSSVTPKVLRRLLDACARLVAATTALNDETCEFALAISATEVARVWRSQRKMLEGRRRVARLYDAYASLIEAALSASNPETIVQLVKTARAWAGAVANVQDVTCDFSVYRPSREVARRRAAHHEAAHAAVACAFGHNIKGVELTDEHLAFEGGLSSSVARSPTMQQAREYASVSLAGFYGQLNFCNGVIVGGWETDFDHAEFFLSAAGAQDIELELRRAHILSERMVRQNEAAVVRIAERLFEDGFVPGDEVEKLFYAVDSAPVGRKTKQGKSRPR